MTERDGARLAGQSDVEGLGRVIMDAMETYPFASALVTGASSGIGEAIVTHLAAANVPVVVVARREDRLRRLAETHAGIEVLAADLTTRPGQDAVAARIADAANPIDLVVNNAGFGTSGEFSGIDVERLTDEIDLNVTALTRLSHAAMAAMTPRGRGWLLNVSSVVSFVPGPGLAVYAATKAYVTSLSESLHEEAKARGVKVTALCPGLTRTEFQTVSNSEHYADQYPGFAWTSVDQVATVGLKAVVDGHAVAVPGAQYKALSALTSVTPRWLRRRASSMAQRR